MYKTELAFDERLSGGFPHILNSVPLFLWSNNIVHAGVIEHFDLASSRLLNSSMTLLQKVFSTLVYTPSEIFNYMKNKKEFMSTVIFI